MNMLDWESGDNSNMGKSWSDKRLVEDEKFMLKQRNRMMYKQIVLGTSKAPVIEDYLDVKNVSDSKYYEKGLEFLKDMINSQLMVRRTVDEILINKKQTYQDLYQVLGVKAFTLMVVRSVWASEFGIKYRDTRSGYDRFLRNKVSRSLKDEKELYLLMDKIKLIEDIPTELKNRVLSHIARTYGSRRFPGEFKSLLGHKGYVCDYTLTKIEKSINQLLYGEEYTERYWYYELLNLTRRIETVDVRTDSLERFERSSSKITEEGKLRYTLAFTKISQDINKDPEIRREIEIYKHNCRRFL